MYIKNLKLMNFRCFEELDIGFTKQATVLIGINGAGKSSILDAISIALGSFLSGCDVYAGSLHKSDVRFKTYKQSMYDNLENSISNREAQYPVKVCAEMQTADKNVITWERTLNSERGRTTVGGARPIMAYAEQLSQCVRDNQAVVMPVIAYYGTGRLWLPKRSKRNAAIARVPSRLRGYVDALDAASNEKLMMEWFHRNALLNYKMARNSQNGLPTYHAVKKAMANFYAEMDENIDFADIDYDFDVYDIEITINWKNGDKTSLPLRYLSDGIKTMLSMVADIAYRMATLNPQLGGNVIEETDGVVLIDEIDMHLHPAWQKRILQNLTTTFPKVQFIVSTHAPAVLANTPSENVQFIDHGEVFTSPAPTYGRDSTSILRDVMGTEIRPSDILQKKEKFYTEIQNGNFENAECILSDLRNALGDSDTEYINMKITLDMEKL